MRRGRLSLPSFSVVIQKSKYIAHAPNQSPEGTHVRGRGRVEEAGREEGVELRRVFQQTEHYDHSGSFK